MGRIEGRDRVVVDGGWWLNLGIERRIDYFSLL